MLIVGEVRRGRGADGILRARDGSVVGVSR